MSVGVCIVEVKKEATPNKEKMMALSATKKAKLKADAERNARIAYVLSCGYTKNPASPFSEANWDAAAREFIETGDESLKDRFPRPRD